MQEFKNVEFLIILVHLNAFEGSPYLKKGHPFRTSRFWSTKTWDKKRHNFTNKKHVTCSSKVDKSFPLTYFTLVTNNCHEKIISLVTAFYHISWVQFIRLFKKSGALAFPSSQKILCCCWHVGHSLESFEFLNAIIHSTIALYFQLYIFK